MGAFPFGLLRIFCEEEGGGGFWSHVPDLGPDLYEVIDRPLEGFFDDLCKFEVGRIVYLVGLGRGCEFS